MELGSGGQYYYECSPSMEIDLMWGILGSDHESFCLKDISHQGLGERKKSL